MDCKTAQKLIIPYINKQLDEHLLTEFLDHIAHCKECYEELEIHFTIQYALHKLDENQKVSFNTKEILREDLRESYRKIRHKKIFRNINRMMVTLSELLLIGGLLLTAEVSLAGKFEDTGFYKLFLEKEEMPVRDTRPSYVKYEILYDQEEPATEILPVCA